MLQKLFKKKATVKKTVNKTAKVCEVDKVLKAKFLKSMSHPSKIRMGLALIEGTSTEAELVAEFGIYRVDDMKRHIAKLSGKGVACRGCYKR